MKNLIYAEHGTCFCGKILLLQNGKCVPHFALQNNFGWI